MIRSKVCGLFQGKDLTWQTNLDLDSAGEMDSRQSKLMDLADGASHDVTMMENSFMHLAVPGIPPAFYFET